MLAPFQLLIELTIIANRSTAKTEVIYFSNTVFLAMIVNDAGSTGARPYAYGLTNVE
jgi:hypothetical protein